MNKKVYILLLNYNGWRDTQECLESVLKLDYPNYQIVVVDNNSPNDSMSHLIAWVKGEELATVDNPELARLSTPHSIKPWPYVLYDKHSALNGGIPEQEFDLVNPIVFIQTGENRGFAAGNNIGIEYAMKKDDADYIWLLNNDTVVDGLSLTELLAKALEPKVGIVGSCIYHYYKKNEIQSLAGDVNKFFGTTSHIDSFCGDKIDFSFVSGSSFFISVDVIKSIGLLSEDYFLYYEEVDYCFNSISKGYKLAVAWDSKVFHKEGGTTGTNIDHKKRSEFSDLLIVKSRIIFHRKWLGGGFGLYFGLFVVIINRLKRGQFYRCVRMLKLIWV
jgi:hypothetical protein